jgi:hypothetical protein
MGAALQRDTLGPIRETCHSGRVLLYGSGGASEDDSNPAQANPEGFKGIVGNSDGVSMTENTVKIRLHMTYNNGHGARNENDTLPEPGSDVYTTLAEPLRAQYSSFSLTGQLIAAAERGEASFKPAFKESMERTTTAAKLGVNRQAFGNGTGVIAILRNNEAAGQTVIDVDTTVYFRRGEIIDGVTIATGVVIEPARKVTDVDRANRTITVTPALTTGLTATTDGWVSSSSNSTVAAPNNSQFREIQGLDSIVDSTGTLHGVSPSLYPNWASYEDSNSGTARPISDNLLRLAKDTVGFETGLDEDGLSFLLITTRGVRSNYAATQLPLKRHVNTQKLEGGFDAIMFDGNPFVTDDHCQPGRVYGLRLPKLEWKMLRDWSWMDEDGAVLSRVPGKDRYVAVLYQYSQLVTTHRGSHFKLLDVTDTVR